MARYSYEGKIYNFEPGLSDEEVVRRIEEQDAQPSELPSDYYPRPSPDSDPRLFGPVSGEPEDEGVFQEIGEGILSGVSKIPQGIIELGTLAYDVAADTSYTDQVTKFFDEKRKEAGIDPTGIAGGLSEGLSQFLIPGLGAAAAVSRVSKVGKMARGLRSAKSGRKASSARLAAAERKYGATKLSKSQKAALVLQEAGAAVAADTIVSTDGTQSIGDFFDIGPTRTQDVELGETGREAALRKTLNKLKIGAESGIITIGLPVALGGAGTIASKAGAFRPIEEINKFAGTSLPGADVAVAEVVTGPVKAGVDLVKGSILRSEQRFLDPTQSQDMGSVGRMLNRTLGLLRYRGFLDPEAANQQSLVGAKVEGEIKRADNLLSTINEKIDDFLKRPEVLEQSSITKQKLLNNFADVLETGVKPDDLPEDLYREYMKARRVIDSLSERLTQTGAVQRLPEVGSRKVMSRQEFIDTVRQNIQTGGYLRRKYRAFEDPDNYKIVRGSEDERQIFDMIRAGGAEGTEGDKIFKDMKKRLSTSTDSSLRITPEQTFDTVTERQMRGYIDKILTDARNQGRGKIQGLSFRSSIRRLNPQLLNRRKVDLSTTKRILGEIKDPFESYIATVSDLSTFIATDDFFTKFRQLVNDDMIAARDRTGRYGEQFATAAEKAALAEARRTNPAAQLPPTASRYVDTEEYLERMAMQAEESGQDLTDAAKVDLLTDLQNQGFYILGKTSLGGDIFDKGISESAFGAMHGIAIPEPMWRSMSNVILNDDNDATKYFLRPLYGSFLKMKGATQYAKTILSPITQVRNVTSASLFAAAQGNFGKGANLGESIELVIKDIAGRSDEEAIEYLVDLQQRGVVGSSAQLREIQEIIRKGLDSRTTAGSHVLDSQRLDLPDVVDPLEVGRKKGFMRQMLGKAEDLYRGGDDIWKIYNFEFEHAKLNQAYLDDLERLTSRFSGDDLAAQKELLDKNYLDFAGASPNSSLEDALKNLAADRVRNLVPNYELVPEAIKSLRKLPVGNFIAFPAEIIRTGFNTLDTAMKELSSDSQAIREIGMRRLMGAVTTFGIMPAALQNMAMKLTETSEEELKAANRVAAPFQRNSIFIPVGRNEKGNLEVIDFSHTNPYDMLVKPFYTVMNSLDRDGRLSKEGMDAGNRAAWEAFSEFASPFFDQSIAAAAIQDVLPTWAMGRGGKTETGAVVYKDVEDKGKQFERSFYHIVNALSPGISPFRIPTGADVSEIEAGRFVRGTLGEVLGLATKEPSTGREYDAPAEIIRALSGLSTQEFDPERILRFKANEFKSERSEAATLFNDVVNREVSDRNDYVNGYVQANEARLRTFRAMASYIDDLKKLGLTSSKIRKKLREENLGRQEINALMRGMYEPFKPSDEKLEEARKKRHDVPRYDLQRLERQMRRLRIRPDDPAQTPERLDLDANRQGPQDQEPLTMAPEDQMLFDFMAPEPTQMAAAPQASAPAPRPMVPQAVTTAALNPIVNPDPRDQALAQALAAKQRRIV